MVIVRVYVIVCRNYSRQSESYYSRMYPYIICMLSYRRGTLYIKYAPRSSKELTVQSRGKDQVFDGSLLIGVVMKSGEKRENKEKREYHCRIQAKIK
jgi:hypothetical protein